MGGRTRLAAFSAMLVSGVLHSGLAEAQVGLALRGRGARAVESRLAERLGAQGIEVDAAANGRDPDRIASSGGYSGVVVGTTVRRGGRWRARVGVFDASGEEQADVRAAGRNPNQLAAALARRLEPHLSGLAAPSEASAAPPSEGRRVVVRVFSGPGSSRVRSQVVRVLLREEGVELETQRDFDSAAERLGVDPSTPDGLRAVALELGLAAVVEGETQRRGRRWRGTITVVDAGSGDVAGDASIRGRNAGTLGASVRRDAQEPLVAAIRATAAPEPPVVEIEEPIEPDPIASVEDETFDEEDEEEFERSDLPNALDIFVGVRFFSRQLSYNDDRYGLLRGYELALGPAILANVRWYPIAHFSDMFLAHVGFDVEYEQAFGIDSKRGDGESFPTSMRSWMFGLRGRVPLGAHEASVGLGYGGHNFVVEPSGPAVMGRDPTPQIPQVQYRYVRMAIDGRLAPFAGFRVNLSFGYRLLLDEGGIGGEQWFPRSDGGGIDASLGIGYELDVGIEIRAAFEVRRYFFTVNPLVGDPWIAGGVLDQYLGGSLGLAWRL